MIIYWISYSIIIFKIIQSNIINSGLIKNKSLKYTFVYVPEGYESNNQIDEERDIEEDDIDQAEKWAEKQEEIRWKDINNRRGRGQTVHICPACSYEWNNHYCHYCGWPN